MGLFVDGTGVQAGFYSVPSVTGMNNKMNKKTCVINKWFKGWCHEHNFGFFDHRATFKAPGLLESDGLHLSNKGKRILVKRIQKG